MSSVEEEEVCLLFPTYATPRSSSMGNGDKPHNHDWELQVHGWIYSPQTDSRKRKLTLGTIKAVVISAEC